MRSRCVSVLLIAFLSGCSPGQKPPASAQKLAGRPGTVDTTSLRGKVMCGYQGWFRCPEDAAQLGWIHWSRDSRHIAPRLLTFEMWPDMTEYSPTERYPVPGFTYPGGHPAELFSSDNARTVLRHFEWMRDYGIDGAWLQHFLVDLPGGPVAVRYPSRLRVLNHVRAAARQTGRAWALSYLGFSWDNLQRQAPGTSLIPRRGGRFLWEQFDALSRLGADTVYVAMFDEVDEGTAVFKVTSSPPTQGHFVGYEGLPSDWYLRLIGEAAHRLRDKQTIPPDIPIQP